MAKRAREEEEEEREEEKPTQVGVEEEENEEEEEDEEEETLSDSPPPPLSLPSAERETITVPLPPGHRRAKQGDVDVSTRVPSLPSLPWMRNPIDVHSFPTLPLERVPGLDPRYYMCHIYVCGHFSNFP
mgnify:CR=1 FL=1